MLNKHLSQRIMTALASWTLASYRSISLNLLSHAAPRMPYIAACVISLCAPPPIQLFQQDKPALPDVTLHAPPRSTGLDWTTARIQM